MNLSSLIVYRNILNDPVIKAFEEIKPDSGGEAQAVQAFFSVLIEKAEENGLSGNIFARYLLLLILNDENIFSISCENKKITHDKSLYKIMLWDAQILFNYLHADFSKILTGPFQDLLGANYTPLNTNPMPETQIGGLSSDSPESFLNFLANYYSENGCGQIAQYRMLKYSSKKLVGVKNYDKITFDRIVGYQYQKKQIILNTKAFLAGEKAHNILLSG
ncbi:MAG: DUF815 domain-containing protein, partial [Clostridiales bacterium]|nr:DUF815 domain-containing protein [Clostridiales bacterium]